MSYVEMNKYWIPNIDINKKVITQEIQYYLGPEATVRPYTKEVLDPSFLESNHADWTSRAKMGFSSQLQEVVSRMYVLLKRTSIQHKIDLSFRSR